MSDKKLTRCSCSRVLFDGDVLKGTTVIRVKPDGACEAKCKFCKNWAAVPFVYQAVVG